MFRFASYVHSLLPSTFGNRHKENEATQNDNWSLREAPTSHYTHSVGTPNSYENGTTEHILPTIQSRMFNLVQAQLNSFLPKSSQPVFSTHRPIATNASWMNTFL